MLKRVPSQACFRASSERASGGSGGCSRTFLVCARFLVLYIFRRTCSRPLSTTRVGGINTSISISVIISISISVGISIRIHVITSSSLNIVYAEGFLTMCLRISISMRDPFHVGGGFPRPTLLIGGWGLRMWGLGSPHDLDLAFHLNHHHHHHA